MNRNLILFFASILIMSILVGCTDKELKVPLEDVGMVGIMAFDYIDENSFKLTVSIPQFSPEAKERAQIFSVTTDLISKGIVEIETLSDKKVVLNQLRVVLINEEFARKGNIQKAIHHLYRNADVGNKVLLAIVKENGEEMLKAEYPDKPNVNIYLNDLLQPSINTAFNPNTNIHDYMYTETNPVFDTIVPLLEKKEGKIEMDGIALFKEKHMLKELPEEEALIIQALLGRKKLAPLYLELNQAEQKEELMMDLINSKVSIKGNKNMESPKVSISLHIEGTLVEYRGGREKELVNIKGITKLEHDINKQIEKDIKEFLEKLSELKVDPIGLSENFRMYYKGKWNNKLKEEVISNLQVDVQVDTSIISTGTLK
ncbi:Ger(x)C family spore germination protein [Psychrobacillus vulpis]|uniref:Ger(X)C family spore germination protein n=1 Tax=Psychrobacillus vulpis TaxID=2325572 RepID=A0A544TSA9_9BACI|nr:Ger(x)C family spore germination protein [Psychrobacillus vulpis]TQR20334.1 Ger(x)C family spore germination protein [Psychrobacillus vulpis]